MSEKKTSRQSDKTCLAPKRSQSGSRPKSGGKSTSNRSKTPSEYEDTLAIKKVDTAKSMEKFKKCVEASTKAAAGIKRLKAKGKEEKDLKPKEPEKPTLIWDDTLAGLEIGKKRLSVLEREIGGVTAPRHVRILPPTPDYTIYTVRKARPKQKKRETFTVMKPVQDPDAAVKPINYYGPRCDRKGQILSYSILGDVADFIKEAESRGEFKEILAAQTGPQRETEEVPVTLKPSPRVAENPKLNEDKALQNWDKEMNGRKLEMKRLAGKVGRPEKELVMTKTDDYVNVKKGQILLAENKPPDVCFWNLQESLGHKQLRPTLTQQERGIIPTPEVSGDAASIRFQKGALREPFESSWFNSTYVKEKDEQVGGVIKIYNQMLFDDLEVQGKSLCKQQTSTDSYNIDCSPGGDASRLDENLNSPKEESFTGPCLNIDDTVLKWEPGCCHGDRVAKTTYILIEGYVDQMATGYINLHNCGTAAIKYHWKNAEMKMIPIPRPRRGPQFYFYSDDGIVLPGDTATIKVNFRSRVPGYFRESLLLGTVPVLAGGAQIKFVLRGIAKVKKDYSQEIKGLQELLKAREATSLCSYLVREIVRDSSLKAHLKSLQLLEEVEMPSKEAMFAEENPGLFFHAHTVKKLKTLFDNLTMELTGCSTPEDDNTVSISQLTKLIMRLPEPDLDEETDEADLSYNRKELLLWQLYRDVNILSFAPVTPCLSPTHHRYIICYQLLQDVTDEMVHLAYNTADRLSLVKPEVEEEPLSSKNDQKVKLKGPSNSAKVKGKKRESPNDSNSSNSLNKKKEKCFSPVYKIRSSKKRDKSALNLYDEKVYSMAYSILDKTVYKMAGLFENL